MTSILEKEKEFHKLNDELEKQTKLLMNEVDTVLNSLIKESKQNQIQGTKYSNGNGYIEDWESYEHNKQSKVPIINKCYQSKIIVLQNELQTVKEEWKNKCNELKKLQLDYSKLEEEKNKLYQLCQMYKEQKEKSSHEVVALASKLQERDSELLSFRKDNEKLKKELQKANMNAASFESKLNKLSEENDKLKNNLRQSKQEEKELKEMHKKQINDQNVIIKRLEKQLTDATTGFKKQMMLIENLKEQKMYLETAKLLQITEEEFIKILDWKPTE